MLSLQQFLARDDVDCIMPTAADASVEGSCSVELLDLVKEQAESCISDGGIFTYEVKGENINFSLWSPSL